MESLQVAVDWILRIVIILFVPALVWVAVIVGLISIVQDKVHKEEVILHESGHTGVCTQVCDGHRSHSSGVQSAARDLRAGGPDPGFRTDLPVRAK